ncbi:MAG: nucleotidyltransferase domain-containing protein [Calditrichaeota bacterium]|nr:nucleotidyltransferase domain-containing protein [Calditrichota bacterium]
MASQSIINSIRKYLKAVGERGIKPSFGVLFGSYVTGNAHEWSDIDLMVVAKRYDQDYKHKDVSLLWRVAALVDSRIEPIPCGEKQWEEDDGIPIIEIVRREGEIILLDNEEK